MITTLIYRSLLSVGMELDYIYKHVQEAVDKSKDNHVTGIILVDGAEIFQVLEGEETVVNELFEKIIFDLRYSNMVLLMQDYSTYKRFQVTDMLMFDASSKSKESMIEEIFSIRYFKGDCPQDDRIIRFTKKFLERKGMHIPSSEFSPSSWYQKDMGNLSPPYTPAINADQPCQFALQPIVEVLTGKVSSYEALIRGALGESPVKMFQSISTENIYDFDLDTKKYAFELGHKILKDNEKLSINLLPGVFYSISGVVEKIRKQIRDSGLKPEQVIIEVTEVESITDQDLFYQALKELRVSGVGFAIDDFGTGYSGLALLTKFQPDKIKIDRALIENIHLSGVKQAVVRSIAQCCDELGVTIVAEGVEKIEEWCWLESVGIHLFQGFLFSRPRLNGVDVINWPIRHKSV